MADVRVRVAGRSFGYLGEIYDQGDELEVTEETVENHPRTLEVIESGSESEDEDENPDESSEDETESDYEICGAEMSSGEICERPADECPYHGD